MMTVRASRTGLKKTKMVRKVRTMRANTRMKKNSEEDRESDEEKEDNERDNRMKTKTRKVNTCKVCKKPLANTEHTFQGD